MGVAASSCDLTCLHPIIIIFSHITFLCLPTCMYTQCCIQGPHTCTQMLSHASEHCHGNLLRNCLSIKFIPAGRITTCTDSKPPGYLYSHFTNHTGTRRPPSVPEPPFPLHGTSPGCPLSTLFFACCALCCLLCLPCAFMQCLHEYVPTGHEHGQLLRRGLTETSRGGFANPSS